MSEPSNPNRCGGCKFWCDYAQLYDDPEDDTEYGVCRVNRDDPWKCTEICDCCELWEENK